MAMERMKQQLLLSHHHHHHCFLSLCKSSSCKRKTSSLIPSPIWGCPSSTSRSSSSSSLPNSSAWRISSSSSKSNSSGWLSAVFGNKEKKREGAAALVPDIVKAGDPVLHEAAEQVAVEEIGSERIQKIIERMISVMRKAPGVGLAAPQIAIPLRIIVLEDTKEYISYASKKEVEAQDRRPFDLLVIVNPNLKKKGNKTALFFEGCLSVDGFRAVVERHLEVEVTGLDREGRPLKVDASGWQARILQHECDHLDGTIYVDKLVPRTFRTVENLDMPLPVGCPQLGAR